MTANQKAFASELASELLRLLSGTIPHAPDRDALLTRGQAAGFLNISARSFDRKRKGAAEALRPAMQNPLRWSRSQLEIFRTTQGAPLHHKRGRPASRGYAVAGLTKEDSA